MVDEYFAINHLNAEFMSKEKAAKYRRTAAQLDYLSLDVKRGFQVNEFT